ncbi:TPA: RpiB/LacA/LacB family sugar-phosphate isomerase, partial [Salmonella enterica subsp. enterica serovar Paratyphi B]|nr:RpiB/LacA/LacB family sugar-phosphate isomerase [Salmonella enterica subsp. enterica serovar Paratyphi B]
IITLGARVIGPELAKSIVEAWLSSEFEGGRSSPKVERIVWYENSFEKNQVHQQGKLK